MWDWSSRPEAIPPRLVLITTSDKDIKIKFFKDIKCSTNECFVSMVITCKTTTGLSDHHSSLSVYHHTRSSNDQCVHSAEG